MVSVQPAPRFWFYDVAELVAILLFVAGLAVSLTGMRETHLTAQAAMQLGGEKQ